MDIERRGVTVRKLLQTRRIERDERGATTAEYAVCTGAAVGFAGLLFKLLTSGAGQQFLSSVWERMSGMLPF
ncbi:MAG: DUF4244 domain-containing protein [Marmoricola sp.]